jgi:regulator of protease activity HflC (stomatin/prohibitin superfamily)
VARPGADPAERKGLLNVGFSYREPKRGSGGGAIVAGVLVGPILLVALGAGLWYWSQWDRVDPGNGGVLVNYCDGTQQTITDSKYVWVDWRCMKLAEYPMAEHTYSMTVASGPKEAPNDAVQCVMKDQQKLAIDTTTAWQVRPDAIGDLYRRRPGVPLVGNSGNSIETLIIRSEVRAAIYQSCTERPWEYVYGEGRNEFENDAEKRVRERLEPLGIQVNNFSIRGIDPDDALEAMVSARREGQKTVEATAFAAKQAENEGAKRLAEQRAASALSIQQGEDTYKLQQAQARAAAELQRVNAEAALVKAESDARAAKIKADSDAAVKQATAGAEAEEIRVKGVAEGDANKARAASITQQMVDYEKWKRWNGSLPANGNVVNSNGPVVVPPGASAEIR